MVFLLLHVSMNRSDKKSYIFLSMDDTDSIHANKTPVYWKTLQNSFYEINTLDSSNSGFTALFQVKYRKVCWRIVRRRHLYFMKPNPFLNKLISIKVISNIKRLHSWTLHRSAKRESFTRRQFVDVLKLSVLFAFIVKTYRQQLQINKNKKIFPVE